MTLQELQDRVREMPLAEDYRRFGRDAKHRPVLDALMSSLGVLPIRVDDLSATLSLRRGRICAVRWDLTTGDVGFKQPVMAAILLFHLWRRRASVEQVSTITDGGNVNTSLALSYLAGRLHIRALHVLSRYFPADIRAYMISRGHGRLRIVTAPRSELGREREFYSYLFELMRDPSRRRTHLCLWHAKYSGLATRWIGEQFAEGWSAEPDDIVLGLGSGSTLEGFAFPLKNRFARRPRIVVAEHARSPLLLQHPVIAGLTSAERDAPRGGDYRSPPSNTVPHAVLGPHYDDVNPFLRPCDLAEIDGVVRYSDPTWQEVSSMCRGAGICVGNSSAANLAVSRHLAEQGRTVFTFLYEPLRDFYLSPHDVCHRPLLSQAEFVKAVD